MATLEQIQQKRARATANFVKGGERTNRIDRYFPEPSGNVPLASGGGQGGISFFRRLPVLLAEQ